MAYPIIVPRSEHLQKIPNPADIGLDKVINRIFSQNIDRYRDFVEERKYNVPGDDRYDTRDDGSTVLDYARDVILHPETNVEYIKNRQDTLAVFMNNPELIELITHSRIKRSSHNNNSWGSIFNHAVDRATQFSEYLNELQDRLPQTTIPTLKALRESIIETNSSIELEDLRAALSDINFNATLDITGMFTPSKSYREKDAMDFDASDLEITATLKSGTIQSAKDYHQRWNQNGYDIPYEKLFTNIVKDIKSKRKKDLIEFKTPVEVKIHIDQNEGKVTGTATYYRIDWKNSIKSLKLLAKGITTDIDFTIDPTSFNNGIRHLKSDVYSQFLQSYNAAIAEFIEPVTALRYIASIAEYYNTLEKEGYKTAMPLNNPTNDQSTLIMGLINPNLVGRIPNEKIIPNDVYTTPDDNLRLITGTNNNGKSTFMDAIGIAQAMYQAGMKLLAYNAEMSPKDNIYTHYIRPADIAAGESRYAHELSRIRTIFEKATTNSLILMSETGSGTSPHDGSIEADTVFRTLGLLGATAYFETHFHNLIDTADKLSYAQNLYCGVEKDLDQLIYTYRILGGSSRESNGTYLAKKMGADDEGLRALLNERVAKQGLQLR